VVEHLPSKCEYYRSNRSTSKIRKKKNYQGLSKQDNQEKDFKLAELSTAY
jgi:hypothetical protein